MIVNNDERAQALQIWAAEQIASLLHSDAVKFKFDILSGDASFRRYFRIEFDQPQQLIKDRVAVNSMNPVESCVAVDSPPTSEDNPAFISMAELLTSNGIVAPTVLAANVSKGFMLLQDLGDQLLLPLLTETAVDHWYTAALATLNEIQEQVLPAKFPHYSEQKLRAEMQLFPEWFLQAYLKISPTALENTIINTAFDCLLESVCSQPQCFVHRDFHSRNLMVCNNQQIGVIDFQDAVEGPWTYDLVSLLKDCYIQWPRHRVLSWVEGYWQLSNAHSQCSLEQYTKQFDLMGLQRHLKVLGIFARLGLRDNKPIYWNDLPLVLFYVLEAASQYSELSELFEWLKASVLPKFIAQHERLMSQQAQDHSCIENFNESSAAQYKLIRSQIEVFL